MHPLNNELGNTRNFYHPDEAGILQQRKKGQVKAFCDHKKQYDIPNTLYLLSQGTVTVQIWDANGVQVGSDISTSLASSYLYEYIDESGNTINYDVKLYNWFFNSGTHPEGWYYVYVKVAVDDANYEEYISDRIWLRDKHKDVVHVQWTNSENKDHVLFATLPNGVRFNMLVNSDFLRMEPAGSTTGFNDVNEDFVNLYDQAYRVYKWQIGGKYGVDDRSIDIINRAMSFGSFAIEGMGYQKDENAKFELQRFDTTQLQGAIITLRDTYNDRIGVYNQNNVPLFTMPGTSPFVRFAIDGWQMINLNNSHIAQDVYPHEFGALTDVDDTSSGYMYFFNTTYKQAQGLKGEFKRSGANVYYENGEGENYVILTPCKVYTTYLQLTVNVTNAAAAWGYSHGGTGKHLFFADGNGVAITEAGLNGLGNPIISNTGSNYTFSSTGDKTVRIYTDEKMMIFQCGTQTNKVTAVNSASRVSVKLQRFLITGHSLSGSTSLAFLSAAKDELRLINLSNNQITGIADDWAADLVSGSYKPYKFLRYIYLNGNAMTTTTLDAFYNELEDSTNYTFNGGGGVTFTNGQTTGNTVSSSSSTARTALTTASWTLTV